MLNGPAFAAYRAAYRRQPVRTAAFAGRSYAATARALGAELTRYFVHERGAGLPQSDPSAAAASEVCRGVLSPHIDFHRGGPTYTWAYRALVERSRAEVFVILGVAHQSCERRFALTRKDFQTPFGLARTDRDFVDRLAECAGRGGVR